MIDQLLTMYFESKSDKKIVNKVLSLLGSITKYS